MKILRSLIKRIEIIAFTLGFVAGIYILIFFPAKYFITRHALPAPPEPVVKIISATHMGEIMVRTASNKNFICDLDNERECWTEIDYEPLVVGKVLCFMEDCSDKHTMQIIKATGRLHNFGELSFIYSLHDDGNIYVKQTGFVYLPGYMMGAILGGFSAFIAFVGKYLFLGIISLFRRDPIK
jgi:hypothetical protein